jgi:phosphatidylserine/phosphatidylglycerophosphate/cardiolipin synthase-like enzyme
VKNSQLHDERTFYHTFLRDLERCKKEIIIESPFITTERMRYFDTTFLKLLKRNVKIYIVTRNPEEHESYYALQTEQEIRRCEEIGVQVLLCLGNHHRKLAILDREILWEGSLEMCEFLQISKFL